MKTILLFIFLLLLSGCANQNKKELVISTNSWIGYTPLFYAKEQGYLDALNIKLITSVSLAEAVALYKVKRAELTTTTQHEYNSIRSIEPTFRPIILLDRSNGGDMILSNRTLKELQESQSIDAYLEIDSINQELIKSFIQEHHLKMSTIHFFNQDQAKIEKLPYSNEHAMLIVTYTPYNTTLERAGFQELASTKNIHELLVVDALGTDKKTFERYSQRLKKLKIIIDKSIEEIQKDEKRAYKLTAKYLNNITFEEYKDAMNSIVWINKPNEALLQQIEKFGYKKKNLL